MKAGDLVICKGFGPRGNVGDTGVLVRLYPRIVRCWEVLIDGQICIIAEDGMEVVSAVQK